MQDDSYFRKNYSKMLSSDKPIYNSLKIKNIPLCTSMRFIFNLYFISE